MILNSKGKPYRKTSEQMMMESLCKVWAKEMGLHFAQEKKLSFEPLLYDQFGFPVYRGPKVLKFRRYNKLDSGD